MSDAPAAPEQLRDGRYRVVRVLGEGAQATTFEAVDARTGRAVAVKRFRVRGARSWKEVELAEREAKVLAELSHGGLPRYVEHFEERGELFLVTEKIEGSSLAALRARGVTFGERDVVRLLRDAAAVLAYLHGRAPPIIHRDIKPSNVVRRPDGSFAIIDFGAVRDRMKPEGGSTVVGTFGYMAPEQFQGRAMPASDVYAVGATALALLTGREPEDLPHRGLAIDVTTALAGSRVSPALVEALRAMLVPDPDQRASSIEAALDGARVTPSEPPARAPVDIALPASTWPLLPMFLGLEERRRRRAARRERRLRAVPSLLRTVVLLALTLAQLAVFVALRVVVPMVLTILSLVFGKGLRRAAGSVRASGKVAASAIAGAQALFAGEEAPARARVEVPAGAEPRRRVAPPARDPEGTEADEEAEDASPAAKRRRR